MERRNGQYWSSSESDSDSDDEENLKEAMYEAEMGDGSQNKSELNIRKRLYFKWIDGEQCLWLTWINDYVTVEEKEMMLHKLDLPDNWAEVKIPAEAKEVMTGGESAIERELMPEREQKLFRKRVYGEQKLFRKDVDGWATFMNEAPESCQSEMMPNVALLVIEAELFSVVKCAKDMLEEMRNLSSRGWKVKLPMILEIDNEGAHKLAHDWSSGGRKLHIEVKLEFLRELKEKGMILVQWKGGDDMNWPGPKCDSKFVGVDECQVVEKHSAKFAGDDESMKPSEQGRVLDSARTTHRSGSVNG